MKNVRISIWEKDEYTYQGAFGFIPFIKGYLHENDEKRPGMIIAPGGGYVFLSPVEAELIAKKFYHLGFQVFVCVYCKYTYETSFEKTAVERSGKDCPDYTFAQQ